MNAHVPIPVEAAAIEARFADLCDNRAALCIEGALELHEAVDECHGYAVLSGLIDRIGQDRVQRLMSAAFAAVDRLPNGESVSCELCGRTIDKHHRVDTDDEPKFFCDDLEALIYRRAIELEREFWSVIRLDDFEYLKRWFAEHPFDVPALVKLYERKNAA
jgi:hypothetical protein